MKQILSIMSGMVMIIATGCLKDKYADDGLSGFKVDNSKKIIEIAGPPNGSYTLNLTSSTSDTTVGIVTVRLASDQPATEDIKVTLQVDPTIVDRYNVANDASFAQPDASNFSFPTLEATIPKGEREGVLQFTATPDYFSTAEYAIGVRLVSVSNAGYIVSGNFNEQVIIIRVKNIYHATYHATGTFKHPTAGNRPIDEEKDLNTTGPNSVEAPLGDLGGAGYYMILTINPDNTVTITPSGVTPNIDQQWGPSTYDPATQTFTLNYSYNTAAPRIVEETLVRQ
ncbi:MAG: DUF1735 domain-containing protein [Bacteroidota bacterium]